MHRSICLLNQELWLSPSLIRAGECLWEFQLAVRWCEKAVLLSSIWERTAGLKFSQPCCPARNPCKYVTRCCCANGKAAISTLNFSDYLCYTIYNLVGSYSRIAAYVSYWNKKVSRQTLNLQDKAWILLMILPVSELLCSSLSFKSKQATKKKKI